MKTSRRWSWAFALCVLAGLVGIWLLGSCSVDRQAPTGLVRRPAPPPPHLQVAPHGWHWQILEAGDSGVIHLHYGDSLKVHLILVRDRY